MGKYSPRCRYQLFPWLATKDVRHQRCVLATPLLFRPLQRHCGQSFGTQVMWRPPPHRQLTGIKQHHQIRTPYCSTTRIQHHPYTTSLQLHLPLHHATLINIPHLSIHALLHLSTQSDNVSYCHLPFVNSKTLAVDNYQDLKRASQLIALDAIIMGALCLTGRGSWHRGSWAI